LIACGLLIALAWVSDAATGVHWYEALLATFSILLWHFYLVIFDPLVYPINTASWVEQFRPITIATRGRPTIAN